MLPSLSIVIPAYNVAKTLPTVLEKARKMGNSVARKIEIVVVNDGSTDETAEILKKFQKQWRDIRVLTHEKNQGYGMAIRDLYYAATMEWLVTLPADDQIDPFEIVKLVKEHDKADMILGKREIRHDHVSRRLQSKTYNFLLKIFFNIPTTDVNTIRLMKQRIMNDINLTMKSPFVDAELILKSKQKGYTIIEVPIVHKARITPGATGGNVFKTILPTIVDLLHFYITQ